MLNPFITKKRENVSQTLNNTNQTGDCFCKRPQVFILSPESSFYVALQFG